MNIYLLVLNILKGLAAGAMILAFFISMHAAMLWIKER